MWRHTLTSDVIDGQFLNIFCRRLNRFRCLRRPQRSSIVWANRRRHVPARHGLLRPPPLPRRIHQGHPRRLRLHRLLRSLDQIPAQALKEPKTFFCIVESSQLILCSVKFWKVYVKYFMVVKKKMKITLLFLVALLAKLVSIFPRTRPPMYCYDLRFKQSGQGFLYSFTRN